jgi:type IV pilus assembly protein PilB
MKGHHAYDWPVTRLRIGELLLSAKAITKEQLEDALSAQRDSTKKLGQILIERGYVSEGQLTQSLSLQLSIPWVSLYHIDFSRQLLNRIPRELAEKFCLIPIYVRHVKGQGETLYVAMDDPTNEAALADVIKVAGLPARPMIASATDIRSAIRVYYGTGEASAVTTAPTASAQAPTTKPDATPPVTKPEAAQAQAPAKPPPPKPAPPANAAPSSSPRNDQSTPPPPSGSEELSSSEMISAEPAPPTVLEGKGRLESADSPDASPDVEATVIDLQRKKGPRMVALTLLDGTTITLPAQKSRPSSMPPPPGSIPDQLTARDLITALRASALGADASEVLGENHRLEPILAALLSLLLRKGLIADWEFVEELHKV